MPTIAMLLLLPLFISLGLWQTHRAEFKQKLQDSYDQAALSAPLILGAEPLNVATMQYHRVKVWGHYETAYQILLDNQISHGKAGYQVVTPLHIEGSDKRILVNRGWVVENGDRRIMPDIATPDTAVEVSGILIEPSALYMELGEVKSTGKEWKNVWQNLDIKRYRKSVSFPLQPMVIELDPASTAGGFVRDWSRPDAKVDMHKGYALQWYSLALMVAIYYLIISLRKRT
jgi:surfeit locus 1 family protein